MWSAGTDSPSGAGFSVGPAPGGAWTPWAAARTRWGRVAACVAALSLSSCSGGTSEPARNLILISVDTLRADRLGAYGYGRETSPRIDAFAERGALFEDVVTECSWTLPAHMTMLTGLDPVRHGVVRPDLGLGPGARLLAERLSDAGFHTFGATEGGFVSRRYGFARGFERFDDEQTGLGESLRDARAFLLRMRREGSPRCFLFLQTFEVHCPYTPSEDARRRFHGQGAEPVETAGRCGNPDFNRMGLSAGQMLTISDLYDAGIRDADEELGAFFGWLAEVGFLEDSLVVLTSDHGEELGEHGRIGHEGTLHAEVLGVPLLLVGPGVDPGRHRTSIGLQAVVPTVLDLLGLSVPNGLGSPSLASELGSGRAARGESVTARSVLSQRPPLRFSSIAWKGRAVSVISDEWHLILDERSGRAELYERGDRLEDRDRTAGHPDLVERLRAAASAYRSGDSTGGFAIPLGATSDAERSRLRELGYAGEEGE